MLLHKERIPFSKIIFPGLLPGLLKRFFYRLRGYSIGKGVKIGIGAVLIGKDVVIGDYTKIGFMTVIRAAQINIGRFVFIGSMTYMDSGRIEIGEDSRIREQVYVGGTITPESLLKVGKRCLIMQFSTLNITKPIIIGDDTAIGGYSLLFTHSSWLSILEGYPVEYGEINIGQKVWIPFRTFITSGVSIGDHVIITPNTLVSENIPSESIAGGTPLRIGPNFYHKPLKPERRQKVIRDIMGDFINHLKYFGYTCSIEEIKTSVLYRINNKRAQHNIFILNKSSIEDIERWDGEISVIALIDSPLKELDKSPIAYDMAISFDDLNRVGTSDAGEELVIFLSRYGIRFNRAG